MITPLLTWARHIHHTWSGIAIWARVVIGSTTRCNAVASSTQRTALDRNTWIFYLTEIDYYFSSTSTPLLTWARTVYHTWAVKAIWAHVVSGSTTKCSAIASSTQRTTVDRNTRIFYLTEINFYLSSTSTPLLTWARTVCHTWTVSATCTRIGVRTMREKRCTCTTTTIHGTIHSLAGIRYSEKGISTVRRRLWLTGWTALGIQWSQ
jgi:hypothetical protein